MNIILTGTYKSTRITGTKADGSQQYGNLTYNTIKNNKQLRKSLGLKFIDKCEWSLDKADSAPSWPSKIGLAGHNLNVSSLVVFTCSST
jgi:hypothetical protein